mgnify:CR=1 FL=1
MKNSRKVFVSYVGEYCKALAGFRTALAVGRLTGVRLPAF